MNDNLRSKLSTKNLIIAGFVLIFIANTFTAEFLHVKIHELLANLGALILVTGALQWLFDEDSRNQLVKEIKLGLEQQLIQRDATRSLGIYDSSIDSHQITQEIEGSAFATSKTLIVGVHYSTGIIARFEKIIKERVASGLSTQILHLQANCAASEYLKSSFTEPIDINEKLTRLKAYVKARFLGSALILAKEHNKVLRYTFIATELEVWIIFNTSSSHYEAILPAIKVVNPSPFYDFFVRDIREVGGVFP